MTQFQTTLTHFFDQVMGASRLTLVGEVGCNPRRRPGKHLRRSLRPRPGLTAQDALPATGGANTC